MLSILQLYYTLPARYQELYVLLTGAPLSIGEAQELLKDPTLDEGARFIFHCIIDCSTENYVKELYSKGVSKAYIKELNCVLDNLKADIREYKRSKGMDYEDQ